MGSNRMLFGSSEVLIVRLPIGDTEETTLRVPTFSRFQYAKETEFKPSSPRL